MTATDASSLPLLGLWWCVVTLSLVEGFSSGAPNFVCKKMRPNHPSTPQSPDSFPADITLLPDRAMPGDLIDALVSVKDPKFKFRGLLVTVRPSTDLDTLLPGFINTNDTHFKLLDCLSSGREGNSGLTHKRSLVTDRVSFKWEVPDQAPVGSTFVFRFTIVQDIDTYWVGMNTSFTVGRPRLRPRTKDVSSPTVNSTPSSGGRGSQMAEPSNGDGPSDLGSLLPAGGTAPRRTDADGQQTGLSSLNVQQIGMSSMSGQQTGLSSTSGQQTGMSPMNGITGLSSMNGHQTGLSPMNGQQLPSLRGSLSQAPTRTSEGVHSTMGTTQLTSVNGQPPLVRLPPTREDSHTRRLGTPSTGRSMSQMTPSHSTNQQAHTGNTSETPGGTATSQTGNSDEGGTGLSHRNPGGRQMAGQQTDSGNTALRLGAPVAGRPSTQINMVTAVENTPTQRTNTLPVGEGREQRGRGIVSSGREVDHQGKGIEKSQGRQGGMSAWLSSWFGR